MADKRKVSQDKKATVVDGKDDSKTDAASSSLTTAEMKTTNAKKRKKKEKKVQIEISLWINQTKYEYGLLCTFCTKIPAVCHCPLCPDFYCENCDVTAHKTKKRKDHTRNLLSKLNLYQASCIVTRAVRRYGHLRLLQQRCRKVIKRYFDKKTLNYYYYNPVYNTVSWKKPYCLKKQQFLPYMKPEYAASKCQNLYYLWVARLKTRTALIDQYCKIFDRKSGAFYYAYNGSSKLLPRQSWKKPLLLGKRSFPKDLSPIYTKDTACIIIQRKWRSILIRQFWRALARACHDEVWDPVKGRFNYFNRDHEVLHQTLPLVFGKEPWDPNRVPDWSKERVSLFLRRLGLKQYVQVFYNYGVDGRTMILLDGEDYENLEVLNKVHIRKIQVEIMRIWKKSGPAFKMSEDHTARREKLRRAKMYEKAAILIQKHFRIFSSKRKVSLIREIKRVKLLEIETMSRIKASDVWYTENDKLPSKNNSYATGWRESSDGLRLPPIKSFGRNRDYLSYDGWGRTDHMTKKWMPTIAAQLDKHFIGDSHVTRVFTEKLKISGYDEKRMTMFKKSRSIDVMNMMKLDSSS